MKLTTLIGAWLLFSLVPVHAELYTYTYQGDTYAHSDLPKEPGISLSDRMTITFSLDSALWGTEVRRVDLADCVMVSGPFLGFDTARLLTDASGNIISWSFFGAGGGEDLWSHRNADGSGRDELAVTIAAEGQIIGNGRAHVDYVSGSDHRSRWLISGVNDGGATALLLLLSLAVMLPVWHLRHSKIAVETQLERG